MPTVDNGSKIERDEEGKELHPPNEQGGGISQVLISFFFYNDVMMCARPPCEVMANRVLPTIRAVLVQDLVERHGLSQVQVAKKLDITQPAVSQYLSSTRGSNSIKKILKRSGLTSQIHKLSDAIAKGEADRDQLLEKYCNLCKSIEKREKARFQKGSSFG